MTNGLEHAKMVSAIIESVRTKLRKTLETTDIFLHDSVITQVINVVTSNLFEGVEVEVNPRSCTVDVGSFHLKCLNEQGLVATGENNEVALTTNNFLVACSSIDPNCIKSVEFPVFDYSAGAELATVKLNVLPFVLLEPPRLPEYRDLVDGDVIEADDEFLILKNSETKWESSHAGAGLAYTSAGMVPARRRVCKDTKVPATPRPSGGMNRS